MCRISWIIGYRHKQKGDSETLSEGGGGEERGHKIKNCLNEDLMKYFFYIYQKTKEGKQKHNNV